LIPALRARFGAVELVQITGNALRDLLHAPLHLRAREVLITVVHCLEFAAIDRNAGSSEQSHGAAERNKPPQPIKAFLQATTSRDRATLLASFVNDAVLVDMGKEHRGDEIALWMDSHYLGSNVRVHPLHTEERDGRKSSRSPSMATTQRSG
jgi:hypothetical protein